jgi:AcrR family transcriptional regulator
LTFKRSFYTIVLKYSEAFYIHYNFKPLRDSESTKGFADVSVREITAAANSNLAAVNYHFGNKMNLYLAVFKERWVPRARSIKQCFYNNLSDKAAPDMADVIQAMAMAFLEGPITDEERRYHFHLMQREMTHPTEALTMVVEEVIKPFINSIQELIQPNLPENLSIERVTMSILSIISLILYFGFSRPVISLVIGQEFDPELKSRVIDHIVSFALNGINGLKKEEAV